MTKVEIRFVRVLFECPSTIVRKKGCFVEQRSNKYRRIVEQDKGEVKEK